jgi:RHS repeat-associated protein
MTTHIVGKTVYYVSSLNKKLDYTWYVRDASGNVMAVYERGVQFVDTTKLYATEFSLYGSSRLGVMNRKVNVDTVIASVGPSGGGMVWGVERGNKFFELVNHLGDVLATVSDKKRAVQSGTTGIVSHFIAEVVTAQDYYAGGMQIPGRKYSSPASTGYRYGFNKKEKADEISIGDYDFGDRIYDSRVQRFLSQDRFTSKFPEQSPYSASGNNPVNYIDVNGDFKFDPKQLKEIKKNYPRLYNFIMRNDGIESMASNPQLVKIWQDHGYNEADIKKAFAHGKGPEIQLMDHGYIRGRAYSKNTIQINRKLADMLEKTEYFNAEVALFSVYMEIIHEQTHIINLEKTGEPNVLVDQGKPILGTDDGENAVHNYIGKNIKQANPYVPGDPGFMIRELQAVKETMYRMLTLTPESYSVIPIPNFPTSLPTSNLSTQEEKEKQQRTILLNGVSGTAGIVTIPKRADLNQSQTNEPKAKPKNNNKDY